MTDRPNIVVYVSDSLRADHTSCFGYDRETTPHLDRVSEDGVRFSNAFSQAIWTSPSSASILTGLYPETHGALRVADRVPDDLPRLATKLGQQGYETGAFSTVDQVSRMRNFHPGFDVFDEIFDDHDPHDSDTAKLCTDRFVDWVGSGFSDPFFGFIWSLGTHNPFFPRAGEFTDESVEIDGTVPELKGTTYDQAQTVIDLYDDVIRYSDRQFGRLVRHLKSIGEYENTALFFLGDHGELLSEHGRLEQIPDWLSATISTLFPGFASTFRIVDRYGYVGHQAVIPYEELLHVPLVFKPPESTRAGDECSELVQTIDVVGTIVDLVPDVELPVQGSSLLSLVESHSPINEYVYSDSPTLGGNVRYRSVRTEDYKYIKTDTEPVSVADVTSQPSRTVFSLLRQLASSQEVLFRVPDERTNVIEDEPQKATHLRSIMNDVIETNRTQSTEFVNETSDVSEAAKDRLEQLGYVD
ncbi:sulfatase [Halopiger thermotolerans]